MSTSTTDNSTVTQIPDTSASAWDSSVMTWTVTWTCPYCKKKVKAADWESGRANCPDCADLEKMYQRIERINCIFEKLDERDQKVAEVLMEDY